MKDLYSAVTTWFEEKGREFPWRDTEDPYKILIAEMMLQKTSANQVLPVYESFIERYPDPEKLSRAKKKKIKKIVKPLGLQGVRSERLKKMGIILAHSNESRVPEEKEKLLELPGVGEYISNAVLCTAFNKERFMFDSNFGRVIGRFFEGEKSYPLKEETKEKLKEKIEKSSLKEFNLGIIDLGALICLPKKPKCQECPLRKECRYRTNTA